MAKQETRAQEIEEQRKAIEAGTAKLPEGKFEVVVMDPPWDYEDTYDPINWRGAAPYPCMTQDKLLAIASLDGSLDMLTYNGKSYYHAGKERSDDGDGHFEKAAYFSFALKNKIIVTTDEDKLKNLLDSNGKIAGTRGADNALFVLTAEKEFMQAGMQTGKFGGDGIDWDSNILRNIEQAAVLISGKAGLIAIEAQLVSSDPGMAKSIASIVSGLISLQAFATDLEPDLAAILQNTKVDVEDNVLSIRTVIDPKTIVKIISD